MRSVTSFACESFDGRGSAGALKRDRVLLQLRVPSIIDASIIK